MLTVKKSQGGKSVVSARDLQNVLQNTSDFTTWIKRMLSYGFSEGSDYGIIKIDEPDNQTFRNPNPKLDYLLTMDTAKEIAMIQRTPKGKEIRQYLLSLENKHETGQAFTPEQVFALMDLSKAMTLVSVQRKAEKEHGNTYNAVNNGYNGWYKHRANILGYSADSVRKQMNAINKRYETTRRSLAQLDSDELIRTGAIDLMIALGKTTEYATNIGNMCKELSRKMELGTEIWDDTQPNQLGINKDRTNKRKGIIDNLKNRLDM